MITSAPHLTPFESEVMQAAKHTWESDAGFYAHSGLYAHNIHCGGYYIFGNAWGGTCRPTGTSYQSYPTIDAALGRLSRKGLVERYDHNGMVRGKRGRWFFTDLGKELVGLI